MKKTISITLFLFALTALFSLREGTALATKAEPVSCGDYEIVTRWWYSNKQHREVLYRINNKTGETWRLEDNDIGWEKLKEQ